MAKGSIDPTIFVGNWYIRPGNFMDAVGAECFPKRYRSDHRRVCANLVFFDSNLLSATSHSRKPTRALRFESDAPRGSRLSDGASRKDRYGYSKSLLSSVSGPCYICLRRSDLQEIKTSFC